MFPNGLQMGIYRIYEVDLGTYADTYEKAYPDDKHARVFTVGGTNLDVYMANPEMIDLTLKKTDMKGTAIKDAVFNLNGVNPNTHSYTNKTTDVNGLVTIENIASGQYKLTESVAGYSSDFLKQYLTSLSPDLAGLATDGVFLGYTYGSNAAATDGNKDVVITSVSHSSLLRTSANKYVLELTIKNPKLTEISL
jgi:hypothetical protein